VIVVSNKALAMAAVAGLALAGYAGAASAGLLPDGADMGMGVNAKCARGAAEADERSAEARVALCEKHGRKMHLPPFRDEDGTIVGKWVSFVPDNATGTIADFTSRGPFADALVFERIDLEPDVELASALKGPAWLARGGGVQAVVLDAPNAFLALRNRGDGTETVTFTVAEGIALAPLKDDQTGDERGVLLSKDGHEAVLRLHRNATASIDGQDVTVTLPPDSGVAFHIRGYPRLLEHEWHAMQRMAERHERGDRDGVRGDRARDARGLPPGERADPPPGGDAQGDVVEA
jgi:hypothetical protein